MDSRPYPFEQLRRMSRRDAVRESVIARWLAADRVGGRESSLARLLGGPIDLRVLGHATRVRVDPHAAVAEVRIDGARIPVLGSSRPVRHLAQRLLGGPAELDAPRPLTAAEHAIWAMVLAAAIEDAGVAAEVWPSGNADAGDDVAAGATALELRVMLGEEASTVFAWFPDDLAVRTPPARGPAAWTANVAFELVLAIGRCALSRADLASLAARDVIAIEPAGAATRAIAAMLAQPALELVLGDTAIPLAAERGAVEAIVTTGYSRRDMAIPDDADLELTVALGTTRLTLRALADLAVGQVIQLGRPLAGPFELRAGGQIVGRGELVDVDGELGVRVVSLGS